MEGSARETDDEAVVRLKSLENDATQQEQPVAATPTCVSQRDIRIFLQGLFILTFVRTSQEPFQVELWKVQDINFERIPDSVGEFESREGDRTVNVVSQNDEVSRYWTTLGLILQG